MSTGLSSFLQGPLASDAAFQRFLAWKAANRERSTALDARHVGGAGKGVRGAGADTSWQDPDTVEVLLRLSATRTQLFCETSPNVHRHYQPEQILSILNATPVGQSERFDWVSVPASRISELRDDPRLQAVLREYEVASIWLNLPLQPQSYLSQASSSLTRADNDEALASMGIEQSQDIDGDGIVWAVVDSRVNFHPFLRDADIERWRLTRDGEGPVSVVEAENDIVIDKSHGTQMAGLIHTVAPRAKIFSIALTASDDEEKVGSLAELELALEWLSTRKDVHGVNVSLGLPLHDHIDFADEAPACTALATFTGTGKLAVVASGNHFVGYGDFLPNQSDRSVQVLATPRDALVVGACSATEPEAKGVASFSCHGPTADGRLKPDIVAPGVKIWSCGHMLGTTLGTKSEEKGTSHATALVSGACASLLSRLRRANINPGLGEVLDAIRSSAQDLGRSQEFQGNGIIQVDRAEVKLRNP